MSKVGSGPTLHADLLLRVAAAHSMTGAVQRALAVRGTEIVATSGDPHGLDSLAGPSTTMVDAPELTVLPAFADAHEHLLEAAKNTRLVPVASARSIAEFQAAVRAAAGAAAAGSWVLTAVDWHESNLAENRIPLREELDAAAAGHPVLARRGGHLAVANSAALAAAGVDERTPDPPGGTIGHDRDGHLTGALEGAAVYRVLAAAPPAERQDLVAGLRDASAAYAGLGVGAIREAMITVEELGAYQAAARAGVLRVRVRPMIRVGPELSTADAVDLIAGLGVSSGFGDDRLRLWGLKFVLDGGVEGAATEEPYRSDPAYSGHLNWEPDRLVEVLTAAVSRGWRIGTHAVGDRAVGILLDVYERVQALAGPLPAGTLVLEHGLLADAEQRARAARLGIPVTVQHTLLWRMADQMQRVWGPERTARANPVDQWLAAGAAVAAGTDLAGPANPLLNVWGMVTRGTRTAGVQGPEHAIDRNTAVRLYTLGAAELDGEADRRGTLDTGHLADLIAYPRDPMSADIDELPELTPVLTVVGGQAVHDPEGRLRSS